MINAMIRDSKPVLTFTENPGWWERGLEIG